MNYKSRWIASGVFMILLSIFCILFFRKDPEKKNLIPAQSISTNIVMRATVKIDGEWQLVGGTSGSGKVYGKWHSDNKKIGRLSVPACTDRIFDLGYLTTSPRMPFDAYAYFRELYWLKIQRIMLERDELPIEVMDALGMLEQIKTLEFYWNFSDPPPNPNMEDIAKMPNLERLDLGWCIYTKELTPLAKLKKLQSLVLPRGITDAQLEKLLVTGVLSGLRELTCHSDDRKPELKNLSFLLEMPYLESFKRGTIHESEIPILQQIATLKTLTCGSDGLEDLHFLEKMPQLENLNISVKKTDLKPLTKLPHLEVLRLGLQFARGIDISPLFAINTQKGWRSFFRRNWVRIELWNYDASNYDFSNKELCGFRFHNCNFTNANFENTVITGVHFFKNISSHYDPISTYNNRFLPTGEKAYGLTLDQIKSTWNYKHNRMEGIVLPERIAKALAAEKSAREAGNKALP